jgi:two-component system chemotaxis sensor kinase CheA
LGFQKLEKLAHAGENLLSKLRDGQLLLRADIGSALLEAGGRIRQMLAAIGATGADGEEEFQELIERLKALQEPGGAAEKTRPEAAQVTAEKRICPPAPPAVVETPRAELVAKKSEEGQVPPAAKAAAETESRVAEESARVT